MFGAKLGHESKIFAGGFLIPGVESFNIDSQNSASLVKPMGTTRGFTSISGPLKKTMSMSRSLIYKDPILHRYTGYDTVMPMSILDDSEENYYGFESGYMNSYSVNCAVGAVPRVTTNFVIIDEIQSGVNSGQGLSSLDNRISVPSQETLFVELLGVPEARIIGFDYSLNRRNKSFYSVGSTSVSKMETISPIEYRANVQLELDESFGIDMNDFFQSTENKKIDFDIKGRDNKKIQTMPIPNASLVSQSLNQSSNGLLKLNLSYVGHKQMNTYGL